VKRLIVLLALALAFTLVLVPAVLAQPNKPLRYEFEAELDPTIPGWRGSITSGDLFGCDIIWVTRAKYVIGESVHFFETWEITDGNGDVVLAGFDEGVTRLQNGKFTGNGRVTEAYDAWSGLIGCKEYMSGTVDFTTTPWTCTGTLVIH